MKKYGMTILILVGMMLIGAMGNYIMNAEAKSPTTDPQAAAEPPQLRIETKELAPGLLLVIAISPTGNCDIEVLDLRTVTSVTQTTKSK
jgi:hypothetical protein